MRCDIFFILGVAVRGGEESDYVHSLQVFYLKKEKQKETPFQNASKFESIRLREKRPFPYEIETC